MSSSLSDSGRLSPAESAALIFHRGETWKFRPPTLRDSATARIVDEASRLTLWTLAPLKLPHRDQQVRLAHRADWEAEFSVNLNLFAARDTQMRHIEPDAARQIFVVGVMRIPLPPAQIEIVRIRVRPCHHFKGAVAADEESTFSQQRFRKVSDLWAAAESRGLNAQPLGRSDWSFTIGVAFERRVDPAKEASQLGCGASQRDQRQPILVGNDLQFLPWHELEHATNCLRDDDLVRG